MKTSEGKPETLREVFMKGILKVVWLVVSIFLIFTPTCGNDPIQLIFSDGLKPPISEGCLVADCVFFGDG